jgi:ubiquinone/menaquinone biosynthesis C-methylase UbiE
VGKTLLSFRIDGMDYDQTEIASCYDKARVLAPETARLWLDLLSVWIDRGETSVIVDLGCGTGVSLIYWPSISRSR